MGSTGYNYSKLAPGALAEGYAANGAAEPFYDLGWAFPAGSMYSTVSEFHVFPMIAWASVNDLRMRGTGQRLEHTGTGSHRYRGACHMHKI